MSPRVFSKNASSVITSEMKIRVRIVLGPCGGICEKVGCEKPSVTEGYDFEIIEGKDRGKVTFHCLSCFHEKYEVVRVKKGSKYGSSFMQFRGQS